MSCPETEPYIITEICDAVEADFARLNSTEQLIEDAAKFYAGVPPAPFLQPGTISATRWPILCARRWWVRDPNKESIFNAAVTTDRLKVIELQEFMDMAYGSVLHAALGRSIQKIDILKAEDKPDDEEFDTIHEVTQAAQDAEKNGKPLA